MVLWWFSDDNDDVIVVASQKKRYFIYYLHNIVVYQVQFVCWLRIKGYYTLYNSDAVECYEASGNLEKDIIRCYARRAKLP